MEARKYDRPLTTPSKCPPGMAGRGWTLSRPIHRRAYNAEVVLSYRTGVTTSAADPSQLPTDWWTADDCATYLGIGRSTWASYVSRGQAPEPGRMFGRSPAWRPSVVKAWAKTRPRRGRNIK